MQNILTLNISSNPIEALIVQVNDGVLEVLEKHTAPVENILTCEFLKQALIDKQELASNPDSGANQNALSLADYEIVIEDLLAKIQHNWSSTVLLIPGDDYLALDLKLPFSNYKDISRIIELEVQDLVPFDIKDFAIDHHTIGPAEDSKLFDIHAGLIQKSYLTALLELCKRCEIEPLVITTPAAALSALYHISPDYYSDNFSMLYMTDTACYSCSVFDRKVRSDRIFLSRWLTTNNTEQLYQNQLQEFKISLASLEAYYSKNVEKVYVIQSNLPRTVLQNILAREVALLDSSDIIKGATTASTVVSASSAMFVRDYAPIRPITNFRSGEFAFRPEFKQVYQGLKKIAPLFMIVLCLLFGIGLSKYLLGQYEISTINSAVAEQIQKIAPELDSEKYADVEALNSLTNSMEAELSSLGSLSLQQPLDVLLQLSKELRKLKNINISKINITGKQLSIEGTSTNYEQAENFKSKIKRLSRYGLLCGEIEDKNTTGPNNTRSFQFNVGLCS